MPTIEEYNGIPMEQTTETNYNYNVGGEVKKTVPFTKELREWLLMFKSRGIRFADTIDELRLFTKHENKQMFGVIENGSIYQYQLVTTPDDGENTIMPENVFSYNTGRWVKVLSFSNEIVSLWSQMQYVGVWGSNPLPISSTDTIFYINNQSGIDSDINDGSITNQFKTIGYAINRFGVTQNYWNGLLTLNITSDYTEPISILNYFNSNLIINFGNYDISAIEMYGNGNITLFGGGEIGVLKSMLNQNISVDLFTFNTGSDISFTNDYNVTISSCSVREKIRIHDCKGTVQLGGLTIYPPYYVDLLRCKAHVSSIDGDIRANHCFITRASAPYITGTHNVITDMQPLSKVVTVNYNFIVDYPDGRIFKTAEDAQAWITANGGTLSSLNTWTIKLPSGTITEPLVKLEFIDFEPSAGTIINELSSAVVYSTSDDLFKAYIANVRINTINIPAGMCLALQNCINNAIVIEDNTSRLFAIGGFFNDLDLGNAECNFSNSEIDGVINNYNDTVFTNCSINEKITVGAGETLILKDSRCNFVNNGGTINNYQPTYECSLSTDESTKGLRRYTETANSSKFEMVMKTGATTWEWVTVKENTW